MTTFDAACVAVIEATSTIAIANRSEFGFAFDLGEAMLDAGKRWTDHRCLLLMRSRACREATRDLRDRFPSERSGRPLTQ